MVLVLLYMFINIVLSRMLERYRLRVGYVSHAVLFSVTFVLFLLCSDDGFIAEAMTNMLGARVYSLIVSLVLSDTIVWLLAVIETVLFVQIFIVAFMATRCVVRRLLADNRPVGNNHAPRPQLVKGGGYAQL